MSTCWSIFLIVLIWHLRIIRWLIHYKTLSEDATIPAIKSWKKWCMRGLLANQKYFLCGHTEACDLVG
jgi:hypothetical protein